MKIAKHYKLIQDHPQSFELHDTRDGRSFHVAKNGLSEDMHTAMGKIQAFSEGGKAEPRPLPNAGQMVAAGDPSKRAAIASAFGTPKPKGYAHGGGPGVSEGDDEASASPQYASALAPAAPFVPVTPDTQGGVPAVSGVDDALPPVTAQAEQAASPAPAPAPSLPVGPKTQDQAQDPFTASATNTNTALNSLEKTVTGALGSEVKTHDQIAKELGKYSDAISKMKTPEAIMNDHKKANDAALEAFTKKEIDPDRYWHNKSTGSKIAAGLGMILGGLGSGLSGQPNLAAQAIHSAIDRDIEAQKEDKSKAMNLWKMNREATQSDLEANLHTRNQLLTAVEAKTKMFAASMGSAEAQMKFAPILMDIQHQKNENNLRLGLMRGGSSEMDPAQLVPVMVKNPEMQKKVYEEIGRAQNVAVNKEKILKAFDDAAKENTVLRTGAGLLRTPGSVMQLHQLMLPNFKQIDGTVRQAAMDESFHNVTPLPGDSDAKNKVRRQTLADWMDSETAAPTAKGNGLDLSRFKSTNSQTVAPPQMQKMNGVTYVKVHGGWKRAE